MAVSYSVVSALQRRYGQRRSHVRGQPTTAWSDKDLVTECLRGSSDAWDAVVDKYKDLVYSTSIKFGLSADDAAEVFQEVWQESYSELSNLRTPGALRRWLTSVTIHRSEQQKRRRSKTSQEAIPVSADLVSA